MLPSFCKDTIIRIRPGSKESRGSTIPDWDPEKIDKLTIQMCSVQPVATQLSQDGRVLGVNEQLTAYVPEGADIIEGDRIEYDGVVYTINGKPKKWTGAMNLSHIQLNLIVWEG